MLARDKTKVNTSHSSLDIDCSFMDVALVLGRRGLGRVWPNPAVGCVLVRDGHIIGRGWTQPGGRPHAETEALCRAGGLANGATAYVTLEPCVHYGYTKPCVDALITSKIARVVVAIPDPDPRVNGKGLALLRESGLEITTGVRSTEALSDHAGFIMRVIEGRPLVTLKLSSTIDGCIATASGESRWITGSAARTHAHRLRAEHDAVMIGSGTARIDNPSLTCRLPGLTDRSPVRIIVDSYLRLTPNSKVFTSRISQTWVICSAKKDGSPVNMATAAMLTERNVEVIPVLASNDGRPEPSVILNVLGSRGLTRLLVEGGGQLAAALLKQNLVDRLVWFQAPKIIGGDGKPAVALLKIDKLSACPLFIRSQLVTLGDDLMMSYERVQHSGQDDSSSSENRSDKRHKET